MNSVPASLVLSIGVFAAIVTVGRWFFVNTTTMDRLINRLFTWELIGILLHGVVTGAGAPDLASRVFMGCGLMAGAQAYGFARLLFDGEARYRARRRQPTYDTIAAVSAASVLLAEPVMDYPLPFGWSAAVWTGSQVIGALTGLLILRVCVRELRKDDLVTREILLYSALLLLAGYWFVGSLIGAVRTVSGAPPSEPGAAWVVVTFANFFLITLLISVRLIDVLLARTGWDSASRHCRRLGPMWRDLTAAVPEVVLPPDDSAGQDPADRRYRMTVEIWDALLQLRPYIPDVAEDATVRRMIEGDPRGYTLLMARAGRAKAQGAVASAKPRIDVTPRPPDRDSELRMLLCLARVWPSERSR
ncbi:MAB_1171c family putative transporter [Nocardia sp. NPDC060256]|uniref:MAB_1171c family putative transporter n=1 Tax=unclassified Nocardia TaxID=2637762 RepID=UPI00364BBB9A